MKQSRDSRKGSARASTHEVMCGHRSNQEIVERVVRDVVTKQQEERRTDGKQSRDSRKALTVPGHLLVGAIAKQSRDSRKLWGVTRR